MTPDIKILQKLAEQGWISLRALGTLLYENPNSQRAVYRRSRLPQSNASHITTIRVGGTERVYEDEVIRALSSPKQNAADPHRVTDYHAILEVYRSIKRRVLRETAQNAMVLSLDTDFFEPE